MKVKYNWFPWERVVALQAPKLENDPKLPAKNLCGQQVAAVNKPEQIAPGVSATAVAAAPGDIIFGASQYSHANVAPFPTSFG